MAPRAIIEYKQIGYWIEFGANSKTTSFLEIPSWVFKACESLATVVLKLEKVRVWPESESINAGLFG